MFGLVLANNAAAPPYSVKRTLRRLELACISVIQLRRPVVPVETDPAACASASARMITIPASQTIYTVNTTTVTANSEILIQQMRDNSGL